MSNAVRAGVVTPTPRTRQTSAGASSQVYATMPGGACLSARMTSAGAEGTSHFEPKIAADDPHSVAPVASHALIRAVMGSSRATPSRWSPTTVGVAYANRAPAVHRTH